MLRSLQVHYDRYNKRFGKDGIHETLTWEAQKKDVEDFKEKFIFPEMIDGEVKVNDFDKKYIYILSSKVDFSHSS